MAEEIEPTRQSSAGPWLGLALVVAMLGSILLTFGRLQGLSHADTLIPVFSSVYRWTWFYWGQNRFGQPVGLMLAWLKHPLWNLLAQNAISTFFALLSFPLGAALIAGWRRGVPAGLLGASLSVALSPDELLREYLLIGQPYAISLAFGFAGIHLLKSQLGPIRRYGLAAACLFLSLWTSLPTVLLLLLLALLPGVAARRILLELILLSFTINLAITIWYPVAFREQLVFVPMAAFPGILLQLLHNLWRDTAQILTVCVALAAAGLMLARSIEKRKEVVSAVIFLVAALAYVVAVCLPDHVVRNDCNSRYALPSLILASAAMLAVGAGALSRMACAPASAIFSMLLAVICITRFGPPAPWIARHEIDRVFGRHTQTVLDARSTHVLGSYWEVWGTVFHANLVLHESGSNRTIWPLAPRAGEVEPLWRPALAGGRIGVLQTPQSRKWAKFESVVLNVYPLRLIERDRQIAIYEIASPDIAQMGYRVPFGQSTTPYSRD